MSLTFTASSTAPPRGPNADAQMAFRTYRSYLEAVCAWATSVYPHPDGMLAGLSGAVRAQRWRATNAPGGRQMLPRPGQILRNA
jgi:hypothetical protein